MPMNCRSVGDAAKSRARGRFYVTSRRWPEVAARLHRGGSGALRLGWLRRRTERGDRPAASPRDNPRRTRPGGRSTTRELPARRDVGAGVLARCHEHPVWQGSVALSRGDIRVRGAPVPPLRCFILLRAPSRICPLLRIQYRG